MNAPVSASTAVHTYPARPALPIEVAEALDELLLEDRLRLERELADEHPRVLRIGVFGEGAGHDLHQLLHLRLGCRGERRRVSGGRRGPARIGLPVALDLLVEVSPERDLGTDHRSGRRAHDQVGVAELHPLLREPDGESRLPGDAHRSAAAQHECTIHLYQLSALGCFAAGALGPRLAAPQGTCVADAHLWLRLAASQPGRSAHGSLRRRVPASRTLISGSAWLLRSRVLAALRSYATQPSRARRPVRPGASG